MKVLIIASMLPNINDSLYKKGATDRAGWISSAVEYLIQCPDIELSYLVPHKSTKSSIDAERIDNTNYIVLNYNNIEFLNSFFRSHQYDVIHVYGSEHNYIEDLFYLLPLNKTLFYIQGIIELSSEQYLAGLNEFPEMDPITLLCIKIRKNQFSNRGRGELLVYPNAKNIAGRTAWDKAYVDSKNSNYNYYYVSESLRKPFYEEPFWSHSKCIKHSIFISQSGYPLKGFHMALKILKEIKKEYPDVTFRVSGENIYSEHGLATRIGVSYSAFIKRVIKHYDLTNSIVFLGPLSAEQMKEELLKSNIFLSPSAIENSSNSLQEAMLTGVPCISSDVGGIRSIVTNEDQCILYDFYNTNEAASKIIDIFNDITKQEKLSKNGRQRALITTNKIKNGKDLHDAYESIYHQVNS